MDYSILFWGMVNRNASSSDYTILSQNLPVFFYPPSKNWLIQIILFGWNLIKSLAWILLKFTRLKSKVFPKLEQTIFKCMMTYFIWEEISAFYSARQTLRVLMPGKDGDFRWRQLFLLVLMRKFKLCSIFIRSLDRLILNFSELIIK